jgi:putative transcriptional regulator
MAKEAFDKIMAGLDDALAYVEGEEGKAVRHVVKTPDVAAIRKNMKLSRPKFAERFGLDVRAVQDWEQGRRRPDRAAQVLLKVIERTPEAVAEAVSAK